MSMNVKDLFSVSFNNIKNYMYISRMRYTNNFADLLKKKKKTYLSRSKIKGLQSLPC